MATQWPPVSLLEPTIHPSDDDAEILYLQFDEGAGNLDWIHLDALRPVEAIVADIAARLSKMA
jgi:hypothetical protein